MAINKIVFGDETLIDLTADTATADKVLKNYTFHDATGASKSGSCTFDSDTSDATVLVAEMLETKTAYARGAKLVGTMPNKGKQTKTITGRDESCTIPTGFHDGTGTVAIASVERAKIVPANIAEGITILGITGTHKGGVDEKKQAKEVTPTTSEQTILPDTASGYTCLSQVTVKAIPYVETQNSAGGITVTIG